MTQDQAERLIQLIGFGVISLAFSALGIGLCLFGIIVALNHH